MSFIFDDNTITIEKTNDHIYFQVIDKRFLIFEKYITQDDLSNNFNIDKFHIFIIKCLEKQKYYKIKIINNDNQLIINFSLELNDYIIFQNIILKLKILTENQEQTIKINILKLEIKELHGQLNKMNIDNQLNKINIYNQLDKINKDNEIIKTNY